MNTLNLQTESTKALKVLSRTQLKNVMGGKKNDSVSDGSIHDPVACFNACMVTNTAEFCANNCMV